MINNASVWPNTTIIDIQSSGFLNCSTAVEIKYQIPLFNNPPSRACIGTPVAFYYQAFQQSHTKASALRIVNIILSSCTSCSICFFMPMGTKFENIG